jgi:hypothetical protein
MERLQKLIDRLDARIKIYNAIGCKTYEKVVWAQAVDTYIAPVWLRTYFFEYDC